MEVKLVASTKLGYEASKEELDKLGGFAAGVCYLPDTIDVLLMEDPEKTFKRVEMTKSSGHHSPYDHSSFTLELTNIPKILAMYLNNEKMYTTSEKSARYKRMPLPINEQILYEKWIELYKKEITKKVQPLCPSRFTDKKIEKLAQENARYLTSVFTPTSMFYTLTYRQFNVLYALFTKEYEYLSQKYDKFSRRLCCAIEGLLRQFEELPYLDTKLAENKKNRSLSLINRREQPVVKQFGDVYSLSYKGSYAQLAQAHRHRTISYNFYPNDKLEFFIPPIIKSKPELVKEWLADCVSLAESFPQGTLININEMGTIDDFILKLYERNCTEAQLEIDNRTTATKNEMYESLTESGHPRASELKPFMNGSRCTAGYNCATPCGFKDGINGTRII